MNEINLYYYYNFRKHIYNKRILFTFIYFRKKKCLCIKKFDYLTNNNVCKILKQSKILIFINN